MSGGLGGSQYSILGCLFHGCLSRPLTDVESRPELTGRSVNLVWILEGGGQATHSKVVIGKEVTWNMRKLPKYQLGRGETPFAKPSVLHCLDLSQELV
jgi:hypothetical protein